MNDSSFWDITFDRLTAENIQLISNNALGKSAKTIKSIQIGVGNVNHQPPEYHVWKFFSGLVNLEDISIDLNITEIQHKLQTIRFLYAKRNHNSK